MHAHEFKPFDLDRRKMMLKAYLDLVAAVPIFDVQFRRGAKHFPDLLDSIIDVVGLGEPMRERTMANHAG